LGVIPFSYFFPWFVAPRPPPLFPRSASAFFPWPFLLFFSFRISTARTRLFFFFFFFFCFVGFYRCFDGFGIALPPKNGIVLSVSSAISKPPSPFLLTALQTHGSPQRKAVPPNQALTLLASSRHPGFHDCQTPFPGPVAFPTKPLSFFVTAARFSSKLRHTIDGVFFFDATLLDLQR